MINNNYLDLIEHYKKEIFSLTEDIYLLKNKEIFTLEIKYFSSAKELRFEYSKDSVTLQTISTRKEDTIYGLLSSFSIYSRDLSLEIYNDFKDNLEEYIKEITIFNKKKIKTIDNYNSFVDLIIPISFDFFNYLNTISFEEFKNFKGFQDNELSQSVNHTISIGNVEITIQIVLLNDNFNLYYDIFYNTQRLLECKINNIDDELNFQETGYNVRNFDKINWSSVYDTLTALLNIYK